jgi:hypothetical protein
MSCILCIRRRYTGSRRGSDPAKDRQCLGACNCLLRFDTLDADRADERIRLLSKVTECQLSSILRGGRSLSRSCYRALGFYKHRVQRDGCLLGCHSRLGLFQSCCVDDPIYGLGCDSDRTGNRRSSNACISLSVALLDLQALHILTLK